MASSGKSRTDVQAACVWCQCAGQLLPQSPAVVVRFIARRAQIGNILVVAAADLPQDREWRRQQTQLTRQPIQQWS